MFRMKQLMETNRGDSCCWDQARMTSSRGRMPWVLFLLLASIPKSDAWCTPAKKQTLSFAFRNQLRLHNPPARQKSRHSSKYTDNDDKEWDLRDVTHMELGQCADVIMSSFYNTTVQSPWKQLYRMSELNRIQQGYPYADDRSLHRMMAITKQSKGVSGQRDTRIVGFVDIDARTPTNRHTYSYNPRPYLSDLCVHPDNRRQGLAQALVLACEDFVCTRVPAHKRYNTESEDLCPELYIRVEASNEAAVLMYRKLGYSQLPNPDSSDGKILILHKFLVENSSTAGEDDLPEKDELSKDETKVAEST